MSRKNNDFVVYAKSKSGKGFLLVRGVSSKSAISLCNKYYRETGCTTIILRHEDDRCGDTPEERTLCWSVEKGAQVNSMCWSCEKFMNGCDGTRASIWAGCAYRHLEVSKDQV